jgi:hypothetical protein
MSSSWVVLMRLMMKEQPNGKMMNTLADLKNIFPPLLVLNCSLPKKMVFVELVVVVVRDLDS